MSFVFSFSFVILLISCWQLITNHKANKDAFQFLWFMDQFIRPEREGAVKNVNTSWEQHGLTD